MPNVINPGFWMVCVGKTFPDCRCWIFKAWWPSNSIKMLNSHHNRNVFGWKSEKKCRLWRMNIVTSRSRTKYFNSLYCPLLLECLCLVLNVWKITELVKQGHCQLACGRYFDAKHKSEMNFAPQHPNQYYDKSRELLAEDKEGENVCCMYYWIIVRRNGTVLARSPDFSQAFWMIDRIIPSPSDGGALPPSGEAHISVSCPIWALVVNVGPSAHLICRRTQPWPLNISEF